MSVWVRGGEVIIKAGPKAAEAAKRVPWDKVYGMTGKYAKQARVVVKSENLAKLVKAVKG